MVVLVQVLLLLLIDKSGVRQRLLLTNHGKATSTLHIVAALELLLLDQLALLRN